MFVFDLETYNDQELAKSYAAGLYDVNRLRDRCDRDLTPDAVVTETDNVIAFDGCIANLVMTVLEYVSENYEGDKRTYIDKDGVAIVSSYRLLLVAHNVGGFDCWVVLNSSVKR